MLGPDLLTVHIDGADMPLYQWLAQQLAARNNIASTDLPPDFCLNDVVAHHVKKGGERNALYSQINHCLADARLSPDVPALHGLATILPLNLFVTLRLAPKTIARIQGLYFHQPSHHAMLL